MVVYVDDILVTGTNLSNIEDLKAHLHQAYSINKYLGSLHFFRGMKVSYSPKRIILTQAKFTKELLHGSGLTKFKKVHTPLTSHLKLSTIEGTPLPNPTIYRSLVGTLNFLTTTRPHISYSVQTLANTCRNPLI